MTDGELREWAESCVSSMPLVSQAVLRVLREKAEYEPRAAVGATREQLEEALSRNFWGEQSCAPEPFDGSTGTPPSGNAGRRNEGSGA